MNVIKGPAAIAMGGGWRGCASGNSYCDELRATSEEALEDAIKKEAQMSTELSDIEKALLKFINDTPVVLSCLYDIDLLPEQLERGSRKWGHMLIIAQHFKVALGEAAIPKQLPLDVTTNMPAQILGTHSGLALPE